ncbi:MAG: methylenetetrahydrofolate reductase, partial [Planctomycetota bacterium]
MHIQDIFADRSTTFSFEFFPPKSKEAAESLVATVEDLASLKPAFASVTYGAGGSTRELTHDLVERIKTTTSISTVPHLTCVCHSADDIREILERYASIGVSNLLALGGDPPRDLAGYSKAADHFQHAADLVKFIRDFRGHDDPRGFGVGVAGFPEGHPATPNRLLEMDYLKAKIDAGADYICTQLFFNNDDFYDFRERCEL